MCIKIILTWYGSRITGIIDDLECLLQNMFKWKAWTTIYYLEVFKIKTDSK